MLTGLAMPPQWKTENHISGADSPLCNLSLLVYARTNETDHLPRRSRGRLSSGRVDVRRRIGSPAGEGLAEADPRHRRRRIRRVGRQKVVRLSPIRSAALPKHEG